MKSQAYHNVLLLLFAMCLFGCFKPPIITPESQAGANAAIDLDKAQKISDSIVADLMQNDRVHLRTKMEKDFIEYYDENSFGSIIDQMFTTYGTPLEAWYIKNELGRKTGSGGYDKPMRKFWYAVQTSKHKKGVVYLTVEIVPDDGGLASSGVAMVTFPMGVPPDFR